MLDKKNFCSYYFLKVLIRFDSNRIKKPEVYFDLYESFIGKRQQINTVYVKWIWFPICSCLIYWAKMWNQVEKYWFKLLVVSLPTFAADAKVTQRTFWYCNDIGVASPTISVWHCWYIVNETHDCVNLRYQPDIKILRLDQSNFNFVMTSSQ